MSYPDRYKLLRRERNRRDLRSAVLYLVVALAALAVACWLSSMPVFGQTVEPLAASADAVCEIKTSDGGVGNGTLVDVTDGVGTVVTCSHNCPAGIQWIVCCFRGACYSARVDQVDRLNELAIVRCSAPVGVRPMPIEADGSIPQGQVCIAYRRQGQMYNAFGEARGPALQNVSPSNPDHAVISVYGANTPPGSSGGAVVNTAGKLVAVHFGNPGGVAQVSCGQPLKRILDWALPRRSGRLIPHATRPSVYVRPPQATQPAPQQPPPGYDDPWQSSGNPSQANQPDTYAGGAQGPAPGLNEEVKAPEATAAAPVFDTEWANQVDRNINTLDQSTKHLQENKQDKGEFVPMSEFKNSMTDVKTDIEGEDGKVARAINARIQGLLVTVGNKAGDVVNEKLGPIDQRLAAAEKRISVQLVGRAAEFLGVTIPLPVQVAGSMIGGYALPAMLGGYVFYRWWKGKKSNSSPGAGGAGGSGSFRRGATPHR